MADLIPHVSPSADLVYRVNRRGRPLFQPPDWEHAGPEQKFNGRYDDPAGLSMPQALRFRTIYCGTRSAALSEIIAGKGLRPDLQTIAQLKTLDPNLPAEPRSLGFTIF